MPARWSGNTANSALKEPSAPLCHSRGPAGLGQWSFSSTMVDE
jgi:hypothetical protein